MTSLKNWTQAHRSTSGNSFIPSSTNLSSIFVSLDAITTSKFMLHWLLLLPHTPLPICRVILLRSPYFHCAYTLELCCWATRWVGTEEWWLLFFFNAKGFLSGLSERPRPHPPNVRRTACCPPLHPVVSFERTAWRMLCPKVRMAGRIQMDVFGRDFPWGRPKWQPYFLLQCSWIVNRTVTYSRPS
jgi:hypothetical protein